jgi:hypothetical protein
MRRRIIMLVAALIAVLAIGGALAASRHVSVNRTGKAAAPPAVPVVGGWSPAMTCRFISKASAR